MWLGRQQSTYKDILSVCTVSRKEKMLIVLVAKLHQSHILFTTDFNLMGSCDGTRWRVLLMCLGVHNCFPLFLSSVQLETSFHKDHFLKIMATSLEELGNYVQDILDEVCAIEFSLPLLIINIFSFVRLAHLLVRRRRLWINWKSISQSLAWRRTTRRKLGQRRVGITFWHCNIPLNVMVRVLLSFLCDED